MTQQRFTVDSVRFSCSCKAAVSDLYHMAGVMLTLPVSLHENKLTWSPSKTATAITKCTEP